MFRNTISTVTKYFPFSQFVQAQTTNCSIGKIKNSTFIITYCKVFSTSSKYSQESDPSTSGGIKGLELSFPSVRSLPVITSRKLKFTNPYSIPQQAWLESLDTIDENKIGIIDLHPDIFGTFPRIDIIQHNVHWQQKYREISYDKTQTRAEMRGGGRKPWQQKGTGRARHGSIRSPLWKGGGRAFGPRGPKSYFYMLSDHERTTGITSVLSVKFAQNDIHIVDSLDLPTDDQEYMEDLVDTRFWGFSVLFVDDKDVMSRNISVATRYLDSINLMPVYGLNVFSMLKHETLVLTLAAVEKLEEKLLYQLHKTERYEKYHLPQ